MNFYTALGLKPGVTSVIGGGGKSTLLEVLARELDPASVILCTTTHMFPPAGVTMVDAADEDEPRALLAARRVLCVGRLAQDGRLRAPQIPLERLATLADYVIVEADGSRRLPLKAHAPHEPVVPRESGRTVGVVGLSGLGRPIREVAHRPERYAALAGTTVEEVVTPALAARVINAEGLCDVVYLNQADDEAMEAAARAMGRFLACPVVYGSLHGRKCKCL